MTTTLHKEGSITFRASTGLVTSAMSVFYNPIMKLNRDISISIARYLNLKEYTDILAGSGIRSLRLLNEANVSHVNANDHNPKSVKAIHDNAKRNKLTKRITITKEDARRFLENSTGHHAIDIDPYGSPNPYLDPALRQLTRGGLLAITATDTAPLAGTYHSTCKRNYWATPLRNHLKHDIALRILTRKAQLIGAQYDKALTPIYSHSTNHYYRIYFHCEKGGTKSDEIIRQERTLDYHTPTMTLREGTTIGPLWTGTLWNEELAQHVATEVQHPITTTIAKESTLHVIHHYDLHELSSRLKQECPPFEHIITTLHQQGYKATRIHTNSTGIKTTASYEELARIIKAFNT